MEAQVQIKLPTRWRIIQLSFDGLSALFFDGYWRLSGWLFDEYSWLRLGFLLLLWWAGRFARFLRFWIKESKSFSDFFDFGLRGEGFVVIVVVVIIDILHKSWGSSLPFAGFIVFASSFPVIIFHISKIEAEVIVGEWIFGQSGVAILWGSVNTAFAWHLADNLAPKVKIIW
jgi:hypothetical protein